MLMGQQKSDEIYATLANVSEKVIETTKTIDKEVIKIKENLNGLNKNIGAFMKG